MQPLKFETFQKLFVADGKESGYVIGKLKIFKLNITSVLHPHVPSTVEDFKSFFTNKITTFRVKATQAKSCDMICCIRSAVSDKPCVGTHRGALNLL